MNQMKKRAASVALAAVMLFGSGFIADTGAVGFLPVKPIVARAETVDFTINGITYEVAINGGVVVKGCRAMSSVNIPSEVECFGNKYKVVEIGRNAFVNNDSIKSISIPEYVTFIPESAFSGCSSLNSITVSANNQNYSSYDGILYNKTRTKLIKYPSGKTGSLFSIPNTVGILATYAFDNCHYLETIEIPASTTYIYNYAFNNCRNLKEIKVDSNNNNFCSENGVLYTKNKSKLVKYPGASSDTSFKILKEVNQIAADAFLDAVNLSTIYVEDGNSSFKAESGVLFDSSKTRLILYPASKDGKVYYVPSSVTEIDQYAFANTIVTDLRNMDKRISASNNFMEHAYITHINGSSSLTSENAGFVLSNLEYIRNSRFIINAVKAKVKEAQNYLKNNYQRYKNDMPKANDEAIKARAMRDWLCENVMYVPSAIAVYGLRNYSAGDIPSQEEQAGYEYAAYIESGVTYNTGTGNYYVDDINIYRYHNAIGALLMPFTVCEGYAEAYQLLLKSVSVECEVVIGANNAHAWNVVKIGDKYYAVDCNADDYEYGGPKNTHFLISQDNLSKMGVNYYDPRVFDDSQQAELIYNVLGTKHISESDDYIRANYATSNYSFE